MRKVSHSKCRIVYRILFLSDVVMNVSSPGTTKKGRRKRTSSCATRQLRMGQLSSMRSTAPKMCWHFFVGIRCTTVDPHEQELCITLSTDVDGIAVEWNNTVGIGLPIGHLQIVSKRLMRQIYGMVKKHIDLRCFSDNARQSIKGCVSVQLFYDSSGWETWLGFLPTPQSVVVLSSATMKRVALRSLAELKSTLQSKLRGLVGTGVAKNTLAKNNLLDITKLRILPDDQEVILRVFDNALDSTDTGTAEVEKVVFSFRFGDRCKNQ